MADAGKDDITSAKLRVTAADFVEMVFRMASSSVNFMATLVSVRETAGILNGAIG